jgi:hypothetical protein
MVPLQELMHAFSMAVLYPKKTVGGCAVECVQLGSFLQNFAYRCIEMYFPGKVRHQSLNNSQGETSIRLPF